MPEMTIEQAQEKILSLTEELENLRTQNETLSADNETMSANIEDLRKLNQKYFNKLIAQDTALENNTVTKEETADFDGLIAELIKGGF